MIIGFIIGAGSISYSWFNNIIDNNTKENTQAIFEIKQKINTLKAGIEKETERRDKILGIQKIIQESNDSLDQEIAFMYAEEIVNTTDRYEWMEPELLTSLIYQESRFNVKAVSHASAKGLTQVIPETANWICLAWGVPYYEGIEFEPKTSIRMGAWYLDWVYNNSKDKNDLELTLAHYNGGPRQSYYYKLKRHLLLGTKLDAIKTYDAAKLANETKNYVKKIVERKKKYEEFFEKG